jgi:hypothetical protein
MTFLSGIARSKRDPKIIRSGPSSLPMVDRLARGLGWFSIGLGLAEMIAPRRFTTFLGMRGREPLVRAFGAREIASGVLSLSIDKQAGLWSRVVGDTVDLLALHRAYRPGNWKRDNVFVAMALVSGITALDLLAARATQTKHTRRRSDARDYSDRSGFPQGLAAARQSASSDTGDAGGRAPLAG